MGSIFLYARRRQRSAVTQLDQKVFETALGGLAVGVLNTCRSLSLPTFDEYVPSDDTTTDSSSSKTKIDRFALLCRDSCRKSLLAFDGEDAPHWARFFKNLYITAVILLLTADSDFFSGFYIFYAMSVERFHLDPDSSYVILGLFAFMVAMIGGMIAYTIYRSEKEEGKRNMLNRYPVLMLILYPISVALTGVSIMIGLVLIIAGVYALMVSWSMSYVRAFVEVANFTATPLNETCPLLWSDPVAQWVWGLA